MWKLFLPLLAFNYFCVCTEFGRLSAKFSKTDNYIAEDLASSAAPRCGTQGVYNVTTEICCSGTIQRRVFGLSTRCCETTTYNNRIQMCCRPEHRIISKRISCNMCNGRFLNRRRFLCCQNKERWRTFGHISGCCGLSVINLSKSRCCHNRYVTPKSLSCGTCSGKPYDTTNELCCKGVVLWKIFQGDTLCCGRRVIDRSKLQCCGETAFPLSQKDIACCGGNLFNSSSHQCCSDNLIISSFRSCPVCGLTAYNPQTLICCNDEVLRRRAYREHTRCCNRDAYDSLTAKCCPNNLTVSIAEACPVCGAIPYVPSRQKCCENTVLHPLTYGNRTQCCGDHIYDDSARRCCLGGILRSLSTSCPRCRGNPFDPRTSTCCVGIVVRPRTFGVHTKCCGLIIYNDTISKCCQPGNIITQKALACPNCGGTPYDSNKLICCSASLHPRGVNTQCCGSAIYDRTINRCCATAGHLIISISLTCPTCEGAPFDPRNAICCSAVLRLRRFGTNTRCCGSAIYNNTVNKCCPGNITTPINSVCRSCGGVPFNPANNICCSGTVHQRGANTRCCGSAIYDISFNKCCPRNIITPINNACQSCGGVPFNPANNICCSGTLHQRGANTRCCGAAIYDRIINKCCTEGNQIISITRTCPICGGTTFDSQIGICCSETLRRRTFGSNTQCCGSDVYDDRVIRCCPGNIRIPQAKSCQSCSGVSFNPRNSICCQGTFLRPLEHGVNTMCCGDTTFDRRVTRCCPGNKLAARNQSCIPLCQGKMFNPVVFICCNEVIRLRLFGNNTDCCGQEIIDSKTKKCCLGGSIVPKSITCGLNTPKMCGGLTLLPGVHICCGNSFRHLKVFGDFTACCTTNTTYNTATHKCCPGFNIVLPKNYSCIPCGGRHINLQTQRCCGGTIVHTLRYGQFTTCCGDNRTFDSRVKKCCPDKTIVLKTKPCLQICGGNQYDSNTKICCAGGVLFNATHGNYTKCCGNSGVFNKRLKKCCFGYRIVPIVSSCIPCGSVYFHHVTHVCCKRKYMFYKKHGRFSSCCGKFIYSKWSHRCCSGHAVVPKHSSCLPLACGTHLYLKPGRLKIKWFYPKYGLHTGCCSHSSHYRIYDKRKQKCCHGKAIPANQNCTNLNACGPIDVTKYLCCSGQKVLKLYGPETRCCNVTAYHPLVHLCCSGIPVIHSGLRNTRCCGQRSYDLRFSKCCPGNRVVATRSTCT